MSSALDVNFPVGPGAGAVALSILQMRKPGLKKWKDLLKISSQKSGAREQMQMASPATLRGWKVKGHPAET